MASYLSDLSTLTSAFLRWRPNEIALSALCLARHVAGATAPLANLSLMREAAPWASVRVETLKVVARRNDAVYVYRSRA